MKYLFLDIETIPIPILHEDIKTYLMDKKITREQRNFDPNYSKIMLIGTKCQNEFKMFSGEEKILIQEFWDYLKEQRPTKIVTHNGYKFDIPFILLRSHLNNIKIPFPINTNHWQMHTSNHFDLMLFFSYQENFLNLNLEILGKMHGIEVQGERLEGNEIEKAYKKGEFHRIQEKCQQDIEILEKLFEKFCVQTLQ